MKTLRKAVFVQPLNYSQDESRLSKYHGAIFAEKLQSWNVDATKMLIGDPEINKPKSSLLSVSSMQQRHSPEYWHQQKFDLVVVYGGESSANIPIFNAIKTGYPETRVILKMDSAYGPFMQNIQGVLKNMGVIYTKTRNGHWSHGKDGTHPGSRLISSLYAIRKAFMMLTPTYKNKLVRLYSAPDYVSFENRYALNQAKDFFEAIKRKNLAEKIIWLGYPVRDEFASLSKEEARKPFSVISVANWKHAKDLNLHAKTTAALLTRFPLSNFTIIGHNSGSLLKMIQSHISSQVHRVRQIDEVPNDELPSLLKTAQVFMLCSSSEGICSAVLEALCSGCSAALSTGIAVPCFSEFVENGCGTQAKSRRVRDMAQAVSAELKAWDEGLRKADEIKNQWEKTLVSNLCRHLCEVTGLVLP